MSWYYFRRIHGLEIKERVAGFVNGEFGRRIGGQVDDAPEIKSVVPIACLCHELLNGFFVYRRCFNVCCHQCLPFAVGQATASRRSPLLEYLPQHWIAETHHCFEFKDLLDAREHRRTGLVFVAGAFDVGEE